MKKERVDVLAVQQGLFETREQAKRGVMAGLVYIEKNKERLDKPGEKIDNQTILEIKGKKLPYVSRGGLKLEKALKQFDFSVKDKRVLDIGASTGGFTDVALQNGAVLSYALDVGYNQLAWKLRQDERVIVMERMNFRYATPADFQFGSPEVATIDVSFISLKLILPTLHQILLDRGDVMALIKPQFEAGREAVGKHGIVRDPQTHRAVIEMIVSFATNECFDVENLSYSPITGGEGNIEFLIHLKKASQKGQLAPTVSIDAVVTEAHNQLT
ncbi:MAG TPA: TlyA family rRNA (cytidine-2'-O)-methyltransferase [Enterococcus sp.]|nr:TlyA family rRNA (cytidine-2'-O)-methyltransferase [Enterococcus sp.]